MPHPDLLPQRHLSAGAGGNPRLLRRQERGADRGGRLPRLYRADALDRSCAAPTSTPSSTARTCCRRPANTRRTSCCRGLAQFLARRGPRGSIPPPIGEKARTSMPAHLPAVQQSLARSAAAAADLLHRLSGASGVFRAQAGAARDRQPAYLRRYRLPLLRLVRAVQHGQHLPRLRPGACELGRGRPQLRKRPIAVMGDGGFWHNGLITGVASTYSTTPTAC